jgi:large subunit ribosomal protein L10
VKYQVIKNTTLSIVFKELGIEGAAEHFKGPTAVAFSTEDMIAPAKLMKQYADKFDKLSIKGGVLEGKAISTADVEALASIPSKEVLYSQLVYTLISPITKLAMAAKAIAEKLEGATVSTEAAAE